MPRLDPPTLLVPTREGRPLVPVPRPAALAGYTPHRLRRPPIRRAVPDRSPRPVDPARVPAGLQDADAAADRLDMPAEIVRRFAVSSPDLLPPFTLIDGQPYFDPADPPATAGGPR